MGVGLAGHPDATPALTVGQTMFTGPEPRRGQAVLDIADPVAFQPRQPLHHIEHVHDDNGTL